MFVVSSKLFSILITAGGEELKKQKENALVKLGIMEICLDSKEPSHSLSIRLSRWFALGTKKCNSKPFQCPAQRLIVRGGGGEP